MSRAAPETCPNCGADVPRGAKVCPECGADERTGWSEEAGTDRLDLPPDPGEFDYEAFAAREFGAPDRRLKRRRIWWWVALALLAAIAVTWMAW